MKSRKKSKIGIGILLVALFIAAATVNGFGNVEFSDLGEKHWAHQNVKALIEKSIIAGYPDGSFRPEQTVTYGEFLKMATVAITEQNPGPAKEPEHWAKTYYDQALQREWFTAFDIDKAALDQPIPRGYMALVANGVLDDAAGGERKLPAAYSAILDSIKDVDAFTPYEYAIVTAYSEGILTGYPDGSFQPEGTLTRAESAVVIGRLMAKGSELQEGITTPEDQGAESSGELPEADASAGKEMPAPPTALKGSNLVEALIAAYEDEVWLAYDDDPRIQGHYFVGFKAGDMYRINDDGMVAFTYHYPYAYDDRFMRLYGLGVILTPDKAAEKERILLALKYLLPDRAQEIYDTFLMTASKNYQKNEHYMRKEYFGDRPVTMDVGGGSVVIYIWAVGSKENSRTWETRSGEVTEEYYYAN